MAKKTPEPEYHSRYQDDASHSLSVLSSAWEGVYVAWQQTNLRAKHGTPYTEMFLGDMVGDLDKQRHKMGAAMSKVLDSHVLSDWLPAGLRGPQVCRVIGMIGDPFRFPGRQCTEGHHMPSNHDGLCGARVKDGETKNGPSFRRCDAEVGEIRRGTGTRALWHYLGLHVSAEGKLPMRRKGVQATWNPKGRTAVLMPQGVADQIIMRKISPWREVYDATKERLGMERGVGRSTETDVASGSALPPWRLHKIARSRESLRR